MYFEICWCLANLTTIRFTPSQMSTLIQYGLFDVLITMISNEEVHLNRSELALNAINNLLIGQNQTIVREVLDS